MMMPVMTEPADSAAARGRTRKKGGKKIKEHGGKDDALVKHKVQSFHHRFQVGVTRF